MWILFDTFSTKDTLTNNPMYQAVSDTVLSPMAAAR